jgi:hypothetical protein
MASSRCLTSPALAWASIILSNIVLVLLANKAG